MSTDWFPNKREEQITMAKAWNEVISQNLTAWSLSSGVPMNLNACVSAAEEALAKATGPLKTAEDVANCRDAFISLEAAMRDIKKRYFIMPPLTHGNLAALGLKSPDTIKTPVPPPSSQAEADISYPGPHLLQLHIKPLSDTQTDARADHGCRIYWGVLPPGGASVKDATGAKRYLMTAPTKGEDLPHSKFTRKQKETFEFPEDEEGSTVYFCLRLENSKGEAGPWGALFHAIVP